MANTKVEFSVKADSKYGTLYLVGNLPQLGAWSEAKAIELSFCEECGCYTASKMLPAGEIVEFKVLANKNWESVEKGYYQEDVTNHTFVASKGLKVEVEVPFFG